MVSLAIGLAPMIKVLFFAQLADFAGRDSLEIKCPDKLTPVKLVQLLQEELPEALTDALIDETAMVSANKVMIAWNDVIADGDEVAFLPPFSGG